MCINPEQERAWLCLKNSRKHAPHNADIWHLRHHADRLLPQIWQQVDKGTYRLSPMQQVTTSKSGRESGSLMMWSAPDELVLKWVSMMVAPHLPVHPGCLHMQGGAHRSVRAVADALSSGEWRFVYRADIRGYYRQHRMGGLAGRYTPSALPEPDSPVPALQHGNRWRNIYAANGYPPGGPSPQTGAILLWHMDRYFRGQKALFYVRYMDNLLILNRKRWPLRRAIADLNNYLNLEGFEHHQVKTQIGRL